MECARHPIDALFEPKDLKDRHFSEPVGYSSISHSEKTEGMRREPVSAQDKTGAVFSCKILTNIYSEIKNEVKGCSS